MDRCDGCHAKAVLRAKTKWGSFQFCNHCWQKHQKALKSETVQYLDKVYDHATSGL
jgi:hypothetical protein